MTLPLPAEQVMHQVWGPQAHAEPGAAGRSWLAVPSLDRPHLLVPLGDAGLARRALRHSAQRGSSRARLRSAALSLALGAGVAPLLLRSGLRVDGESVARLDRHLAELVGRPVRYGVRLGPARANRKPVLALFADGAAPVAYAKISVNPLTRALVENEAAALRQWAAGGAAGIRAPRVLHLGPWGEESILVLEALDVRPQAGAPPAADGVGAVAGLALELARSTSGPSVPLAGSAYLQRLRSTVRSLPECPERAPLLAEVDSLGAGPAGAEQLPVPFGCWHGDFTSGNLQFAGTPGEPSLVWDWERYETGVPVGYDLLHYALQEMITIRQVAPAEAARRLLDRSAELLSAVEDLPPAAARPVARAYLVELGCRYLRDDQAGAGSRVGRVGTWLLPSLAGSGSGPGGGASEGGA